MDPLAPLRKQDPCWCGSGIKYRFCHRRLQSPRSQPGDPVPADQDESVWLSPDVQVPISVLTRMLPAGTPIFAPKESPQPKAVHFSEFDRLAALTSEAGGDALTPKALGRLRVNVLREVSKRPDNDRAVPDAPLQGIFELAVSTLQTVNALQGSADQRTLLWNDELEADVFLSRTLLLADHIFVPDILLDTASQSPTNRSLRQAARRLLTHENLLSAGVVIPVPNGVARAIRGQSVQQQTASDLSRRKLVEFVRSQLIFEGPTAREVIFATAKDDLEVFSKMWFYAHIDEVDRKGKFGTRMLQGYNRDHDYSSWMQSVTNDAVSYYIQRTNQRLVAADIFGAQYVSASPFEARLLQRRRDERERHPAQSAVWANVPLLGTLSSAGLASLLENEDAIQELRRQVRTAVVSARSVDQESSAISQLTHEVESASHALEKRIRTERLYASYFPAGITLGAMAIGAAGGLFGVLGAALGGVGGLLPYVASRINSRRDASYLYVTARQIQQRETPRAKRRR